MKPLVLALLAMSVPLAAQAGTSSPKLCAALAGLREAAKSAGTPQRVSVIKVKDLTVGCGHGRDPAPTRFCALTTEEISIEFTHVFPWQVVDCLEADGVHPVLEQADLYTGMSRKRIVHLAGRWRDGARIDVRFTPMGDSGDDPRFKDYWGRYDVVVWRP
jgi:hypothetical protein